MKAKAQGHPHHQPPRVAQGQDAEVHLGPHPADQHPQLTKVGLQLLAWPSLVANRGLTALAQRLPPVLLRVVVAVAVCVWCIQKQRSSTQSL